MNKPIKQKVFIGILGIFVLGAGSIWLFGGNSSNTEYSPKATQKKQRVPAEVKDTHSSRRREPAKAKSTARDTRKRAIAKPKISKKKDRKRNTTKTKKKKATTAA